MKIYRVINKNTIEEFFESFEIAEQYLALLAPGAAQHGGFAIEEIDVCPAAPCPDSEARRCPICDKTMDLVVLCPVCNLV